MQRFNGTNQNHENTARKLPCVQAKRHEPVARAAMLMRCGDNASNSTAAKPCPSEPEHHRFNHSEKRRRNAEKKTKMKTENQLQMEKNEKPETEIAKRLTLSRHPKRCVV